MKTTIQLIMLANPLKRHGQIIKAGNGTTFIPKGNICLSESNNEDGIKWQHNELYLLSDAKPITSGWYVNLDINRVLKCTDGSPYDGINKQIIATTNPILGLPMLEESFVKSYIQAFNSGNSITEIETEYELVIPVGIIKTV